MSSSRNLDSDDSLASSFVSSFSLPPPSPPPPKEKNAEAGLTDIHLDQPTLIIPAEENLNEDAPDPVVSSNKGDQSGDPSSVENPVETAKNQVQPEEDWKSVLDKNLEAWRGESSVAREKSESTRLRLEEERVKAAKESSQKKKDEDNRTKQQKEDDEVEAKLQELLNAPASGSKAGSKRRSSQVKQDKERKRWNAVRDAWEIVRDGSSVTIADDEVEADSRDLTAGDAGGLAEPGTRQGAEVLKEAHETITRFSQGDGNLDPTPASAQRRNDLLTADSSEPSNRRQAVGTSWKEASEEIAADKGASEPSAPAQSQGEAGLSKSATASSSRKEQSSSSTSKSISTSAFTSSSTSMSLSKRESSEDDEEKTEIGPIPTPSPLSGPPYQSPSLTLSLFTSPSHRSIARIAAVVGINLILPFINGVMLGFGEIFARETVIFGRRWWRGEASLRTLFRPSAGGSFAGLGLGMDSFGETL